jgi:hypothetical protein
MKIPYFRDWYVLEKYNLDIFSILKIDFYDQLLWNIVPFKSLFSLQYIFIYSLLWFIIPFVISTIILKINKRQNIWPFVLFYFVSYWFIERLLMGQVNVIRGYWLLMPIVLLVFFKYNTYLIQILLALVNIHFSIFGIIYEFICGKKVNVIIPVLIHLVNFVFRQDVYNRTDPNIYLNFSNITNDYNSNIVINTFLGVGSWASSNFIELKNIVFILNPYFNFYFAASVMTLFIFIILEQNIKLKLMSLIFLILSASLVPFIYQIPFMNIFREGGKFYPVFLIAITIHFLDKSNFNKFFYYIFLILSILNITLIIELVPSLNYIVYDQSEISIINSICKYNAIEIVPNDLYLSTNLSNNIFAPNIFYQLFDCNLTKPSGTALKYTTIGNLNNTCSDNYKYHLVTIQFYQSQYFKTSNCPERYELKTNNFVVLKY